MIPKSWPEIKNHCSPEAVSWAKRAAILKLTPSNPESLQKVPHPQHALSAHPLLSTSLPWHVLHHALKHASRDGLLASTLVLQWRQKRVLMRPEAAFPNVFAAEGASTRPKGRHAQRTHVATLLQAGLSLK